MSISFLSIMNAPRFSVMDMQRRLADAQIEVSTGRHADQGLALGSRTAQNVALRSQIDRNAALIGMNELAKTELDLTQSTLSSVVDLAHQFTATLIGARNAANGQQVVKDAAKAALASFTSLMNTTHDGQYLFGGINSGEAPLADYLSSPPTGGKSAVNAAFLAEFGFAQSSAAANGITTAQMTAFLAGNFNALFTPTNWQGTWSQASSQNRTLRVDQSLMIESSANTSEQAFSDLASALTMVFDLGVGNLNQAAFEHIVDRAAGQASTAAQNLGGIQSRLGRVQQTVTDAIETLKSRNGILNKEILALEGADTYEAATRVNAMTAQLEASYALTSRISRLSLLNYL
jgi:flagellar hook-associated protein 3 FlgL